MLPALPRWAWSAVAALGLLITAALWLHFHDRQVIDQHEAKIGAQVSAATEAANETANANDTRRQVENAKAAILTEEALRRAQEEHPAEVRQPSGPAVRAVAEQLRKRAAASGAPAR